MDGITLLENEIKLHPHLKIEDHQVVSKVCNYIRISSTEELGIINEALRDQVEIEAACVYLTSKYGRLLNKLEQRLDEHKAGKSVELGSKDDEGLKWTKQAKEQWLLAMDAQYATQTEVISKCHTLITMLRGLSTIVFNRDRKLEQLSVNYRKDLEFDRRSTGRR